MEPKVRNVQAANNNAPKTPTPKQPLTPQQKRCVWAAASSGALAVNAGLNEVGAALTGEVGPFAAIFHGIALGEGIASGGLAIYAAFVCVGQ